MENSGTTNMSLKGKVALITGATRGIGREILELYAANGASITFSNSKFTQESKDLENYLKEKHNVDSLYQPANLSNSEEIDALVNGTINKFGRIDILVNNAGLAHIGSFLNTTPEKFKELIDVNLFSVILLTQKVVPFMIQNKWGRIINFSSTTVSKCQKNLSAYIAAKSGVVGLTKVLALELAEHNITANYVAPGVTDTDMFRVGIKDLADSYGKNVDEMIETFMNQSAIKDPIPPKNLAYMTLFLGSDLSQYCTGCCYSVDGGMSI